MTQIERDQPLSRSLPRFLKGTQQSAQLSQQEQPIEVCQTKGGQPPLVEVTRKYEQSEARIEIEDEIVPFDDLAQTQQAVMNSQFLGLRLSQRQKFQEHQRQLSSTQVTHETGLPLKGQIFMRDVPSAANRAHGVLDWGRSDAGVNSLNLSLDFQKEQQLVCLSKNAAHSKSQNNFAVQSKLPQTSNPSHQQQLRSGSLRDQQASHECPQKHENDCQVQLGASTAQALDYLKKRSDVRPVQTASIDPAQTGADQKYRSRLAQSCEKGSTSMEDTAQLNTMAQVDLSRINRERTDKLQSILNSNIDLRVHECSQANQTLQRQQERVEQLKTHLDEVSRQVQDWRDAELTKEQQKSKKKAILLHQKAAFEQQSAMERAKMQNFLLKSQERRSRLLQESQLLEQSVQEETQVCDSLQGRLDALRQRQSFLVEQEVSSLRTEDQKLLEQIELLREAGLTFDELTKQQLERSQMIEEDMLSAASLEQTLVIHFEEIEGYVEKLKAKLPYGCKWTTQLQRTFESGQGEEALMNLILDSQMRNLVAGLIRELQHYMLDHASGTTDQSHRQSSALEELEAEAELVRVPIKRTLASVVSFARDNFDLDLSEDLLTVKLEQIRSSVNIGRVCQQLNSIAAFARQTCQIQTSISAIQKRVREHLLPLSSKCPSISGQLQRTTASGAMDETNDALSAKKRTAVQTLTNLEDQHAEVERMIAVCRQHIGTTAEGCNLATQIKHLEGEIAKLNVSITNATCSRDAVSQEIRAVEDEIRDINDQIQGLTQTTLIQTKQIEQELAKLSGGDDEGATEDQISFDQLKELQQKLKYELQSAQNRLHYAKQKVSGAHESLHHARSVLADQTPDQDTQQRKTTTSAQPSLIRVEAPRLHSLKKNNSQVENPLLPDPVHKSILVEQAMHPEANKHMVVVPGLLTNIVKQVRRTTRTQNRVDLAELLRHSMRMSSMQTESDKSEYCNMASNSRFNEQRLQQSQNLAESDILVDTERLLAGRKDKTQRFVTERPPKSFTQAQSSIEGTLIPDRKTVVHPSQHPVKSFTPALLAGSADLDRSGSLANFLSSENCYRSQTVDNFGSQIVSNLNRGTNALPAGQILVSHLHEEQGCQRSSSSNQNLRTTSATVAHDRSPSFAINQQSSSGVLKLTQFANRPQELAEVRSSSSLTVGLKFLNHSPVKRGVLTAETLKEESNSLARQHEESLVTEDLQAQAIQPTCKDSSFANSQIHKASFKANASQRGPTFGLKRLSQATAQSLNFIGQTSMFHGSTAHLGNSSKPSSSSRCTASQQIDRQASVTAHTISSQTKTQIRSQQRNQIIQKYSSNRTGSAFKSERHPSGATSKDFHEKKRSHDINTLMIFQANPRGSFQNRNDTISVLSHARSHQQFKQLASYPKRMTFTMNTVSNRPKASLLKGVVILSQFKEEEFFKAIKPMVQGSKFLIAMDSGAKVEQTVFLNLDLEYLQIESANHSSCAESIRVRSLFKTELPPATLEQMRVYQRCPDDFAKLSNLFDFNLHVVESCDSLASSQCTTLQHSQLDTLTANHSSKTSPSKRPTPQHYRVKLTALAYEQLKEWVVGLNLLIKERSNLTRYAAMIQRNIDHNL